MRGPSGWPGVWIAFVVLTGWHLGGLLGARIPADHRWPVGEVAGTDALRIVVSAGIIAWVALTALAARSPRIAGASLVRRVGSAPAMLAWGALGFSSGLSLEGAPLMPVPEGPGTGLEPERYHIVQVTRILPDTLWVGRLWASTTDSGWVTRVRPRAVRGRGELGRGTKLVRGTLGAPPPRRSVFQPAPPPWLRVSAAFALTELGTPADSSARGWRVALRDRLADVRLSAAARWRERLGENAGSIAAWTLLDERPPREMPWQRAFTETGTLHLLAISGFHLSLLGAILWLAARIVFRGARWSRWVALAALLLYGVLVDLPISVQRSLGMAWIVAAGPGWGRRGRIWNALGWMAALAPVVLDPAAPARVAYQLSVAATAGVLLGGAVAELVPRRWRLVRSVGSLLLSSIGATMLTASWSRFHFAEFYPLGILANLVGIPAMALVLPALGLAGIATYLGPFGNAWVAVGRAAGESFLALIEILAEGSRVWPFLGSCDYERALAGCVAGALPFWLVCRQVDHVRRRVATQAPVATPPAGAARPSGSCPPAGLRPLASLWLAAAAPIAVTLVLAQLETARCSLRVTFLDVGQGDAVLIEHPAGTWLYDLGPGFLVSRDPLVPSLLRHGTARLDRVWISHGDADHWGGLPFLLESPVRVDTVLIAESAVMPESFWRTLEQSPQRPAVCRIAAPWERHLGEGVRVRMHYPWSSARDLSRNDLSVVLEFEVGSRARNLLLVGDLEADGEDTYRRRETPPRALLAQAGHHGSRTSGGGDWYDLVAPGAVIASLGQQNRHRFPHPEVLEGLARRGIPLLRTDRDGAVTVELAADAVRVRRARSQTRFHP